MDPLDPDFDSREEAARAEARKRGRRDRRQKHTPAQSQRAAGLPPQQHLSQLQSFAAPVMMHLGMMPVVPMAPPPLPPGWSVHLSPAGMPYYYNAVSGQSSWTPPSWPEAAGVAGIDAAVKESAKDAEAKGDAAGGPAGGASAKADESVQEPPEGAEEQNQGEAEGLGDSRAAVDSDTEVVAEDQAVPETAVAMKRLPDTPWAIVLTNRRHELYFNSQTKQATWEMPGEIVNVVGELLARAMDVDIDDDVDDDEADDDGDDGDDGEDDGEDDDEDDDDEESRKGESLNPSDTDIHDAGIDVSKNDFVAVGHRSENAGDLEGGDGSRKRSADSADLGDSPLDRTHAPALVILAAKERKKLFDKFCQTRASAVAESATAASKVAMQDYERASGSVG
nr:hypothetical protein HK105_004223 [Polyrhizophydium stewartii]